MAEDSCSGKPPTLGRNLIGFVPLRPDMERMRDKWVRAVEYIKGLTVSEANIADNPTIKTLPDELLPLKAELMERQSFKDAFPPWGVDINMVNLEQIVVFQEFINVPYAEQLAEGLKEVTDLTGLFNFCMYPPEGVVDVVRDRNFQPVGVVTASHEHRVIDRRCLSPNEFQLTSPAATPLKDYATKHFLISFGYTANHLSAYLVGNRLILRNGSHRAFALLQEGCKDVLCAVQQAGRERLLQDGVLPGYLPVCLETPRPPMLKDYLNNELIVAERLLEMPKKCLYLQIKEQHIPTGKGPPTKVTTTYLEMFAHMQRGVPAPRDGLAVIHAKEPTVTYYRFLYNAVGKDYHWYSRGKLPDAELAATVQNPLNEVHVLHVDGVPAGFAELDRRKEGEIELVQFGLMPEFIGQGLGKYFLHWTIDKAWSYRPRRFWLHTCTLDHPAALPNYVKAGFVVYKEEMTKRELPG